MLQHCTFNTYVCILSSFYNIKIFKHNFPNYGWMMFEFVPNMGSSCRNLEFINPPICN